MDIKDIFKEFLKTSRDYEVCAHDGVRFVDDDIHDLFLMFRAGYIEAQKQTKDCLFALNSIRNTRLSHDHFKDTYSLISQVSRNFVE